MTTTTTTTTTAVETGAAEASKVIEAIQNAVPFLAPFLGLIPGAAVLTPFEPLALEALTALDNAAKAVAEGNTSGAITDVLQEVINHLTPGAPNSAKLSG